MVNKFYKEILNSINEIVIVLDNSKIIYTNNKDFSNNADISKKEFKYKNDYYRLDNKNLKVDNKDYVLNIYQNISKEKKLIKHSTYDKLTKLYNYAKIEEELLKCVENFNNTHENFIVVMADVDDFKLVNDTIGHVNSNHILQKISDIFKNNIENDDKVGRFGGEEFLLIFKNCSLKKATLKVNNLREKISNIDMYDINVTTSFGMCEYNGTDSIENVLKNADKALYESKSNGKNISTIYEKRC